MRDMWDYKHGHPKGWWKSVDKMDDAWERSIKAEQRRAKAARERKRKAELKKSMEILSGKKTAKKTKKKASRGCCGGCILPVILFAVLCVLIF